MPLKRGRRSSSVSEESTSVTDYNEDSLQSASSSISTRKKRKFINSKLEVCHCQEILDKLKTAKGDDGHFLTNSFLRLPKKRSASDYYDVVTSPIDLLKIQSKINNQEYENFLDFENDMELLVDNAKMYHTSSAMEYQDAVALWTHYELEKQNIASKVSLNEENCNLVPSSPMSYSRSVSGSESRTRRGRKRIAISVDDGLSDQISLATSDDSRNTSEISSICDNPTEMFFTSVVLQKADSGKDIMPTFTFLPSKQVYPQYYEVIKEPIDLRMIARKIKNGVFNSLDELEREFNIMIKNAKLFNEPKSDVYQDAIELQKIVKTKRLNYDQGIKTPKKRGKPRKTPIDITDKFAQMESPKESDDDSSEPVDDLEASVDLDKDLEIDPSDVNRTLQWQLYKTVTTVSFSAGLNPTEHFMKLPSKKQYPDYYLEIQEPMSLLMVKAKIKNNSYRNIEDTLRDLDLVFNNAQQFNVENSDIYKDAVRLQNLAHMKKTELTTIPLQYSHDVPSKKSTGSATKSSSTPSASSTPRRTRPPINPDELRIKRINNLFQSIYSYQEDNRFLRDIFMSLPSRDLYPNYYNVILKPIDLTCIRKRIDDNKYQTHTELVDDLKLMFSNAKQFNEESSQIYKDTVILEKLLKKKVKNFNASTGLPRGPKKKSETSVTSTLIASPIFVPQMLPQSPQYRIREIFQTLKEYRDVSGRLLSEPFVKLPSKQDMPEYYEYIKKPIEIQTIQYRINNERYLTVEDLMEDLYLMFDNACKFNEPDSQLYRDALILHRVCLEKKAFLTRDDNLSEPPNVQNITNDIMLIMFRQFINQTDEDGRYFVDSLREINGEMVARKPTGQNPKTVDSFVENVRLNLDVIKHHLERKRYKRLDRLQEDVFTYLKYVRSISAVNSQAFEDACRLEKAFITIRNNSCQDGEILLSPALNHTERYTNQEIELEIKSRKETETEEPVEDDREFLDNFIKDGSYRMLDSVTRHDINLQIGDFVRIIKEPGEIPRIGEICALLVPNSDDIHAEDSNSDGSLVRVNWFFYPHQTIHKSTRRLFEKEIFQTSVYESVPLNKIVNKCLIMYIKDYMKQTSKNFKETDIYVCESKYSVKNIGFRKLKNLVYKNKSITDGFVNREESLILARNFSTFVSEIVKFELNDFSFTLGNMKESVLQEDRTVTENCLYYDQFVCENGFSVKVGDYVYVDDDAGRTQIVRIDQLWRNIVENNVYFSGPWFINAMNFEHLPTRMFYRKEVFLSSIDGASHPLIAIIGKCVILSFSDYCKYRPTEYHDNDVFACQFKYFTDENVARKLKKGLKKAQLSTKALDDEIYFFKKELIPNKEPSTMLIKCSTEPIRQEYITRMLSLQQGVAPPYIDEDSKDTSMTMEDSTCSMSIASSGPNEKRKKKTKARKPPSGYVLYASEIRKKLVKESPDAEFGAISREVGQMWRNIPQADKDVYERRAMEIRQAMDKEAALALEQQMRKNEVLLKQQAQQQSVAQPMYPGSPQMSNQRNFVQVPQQNQQMIQTVPTTFQNNGPIQYFQAPNGQVLQFMPTTNVQTGNVTAQFTMTGTEQQMQLMQQQQTPNLAQQQQQVIYQISQQSQVPQQVPAIPAQFMMHQNKIAPFQSPQIAPNQQTGQIQPNVSSNIPFNPMQPNQVFSGFPNIPVNVSTNIPQCQNFNIPQSAPMPTVAPPTQHFVPVPSRSSRVLHSDIYQKYIDKLRRNAATLSDWKRQLETSREAAAQASGANNQSYVSRLCQEVAPGFLDPRLLKDGEGKKLGQEAIVECLYELRDHMMQDAMNIRTEVLGLGDL